ncbi:MAG: biopolymer transporter ExbD [Hydrogenophaga sp.]|nr:biopolymer transporter ExbD [Hydrogenophaga sp.]
MSFGRLEKAARHEPMSDINVTPLVDVMLVLLVIFIITAPLMSSRLELELPKVDEKVTQSEEPAASVSISVDAQGQVFWDDKPVDATALKKLLEETARQDPETELQLRADTAVPYGHMLQLIGQAQAVGLSRIGFLADPVTGEPAGPAPQR